MSARKRRDPAPIDSIPTVAPPQAEPPDTSRPRFGPGAPPLPPAKGRDESWGAYATRLEGYIRALGKWELTRGWSEHDRASFIEQARGALAHANKQAKERQK
jgi:hypothetical protein